MPLALGRPDPRFQYIVLRDRIVAAERLSFPPTLSWAKGASVVVATIEPPLGAADRRIVDRDGTLRAGTSAAPDDATHTLNVLVADPGSQVEPCPTSAAELLALDDLVVTKYVEHWLYHLWERGAPLSRTERDVVLVMRAILEMSDCAPASIRARLGAEVAEMRAALERVGLAGFAGAFAVSAEIWMEVREDTAGRLAAYLRANGSDVDWDRLR
jgi:hypothetical protein